MKMEPISAYPALSVLFVFPSPVLHSQNNPLADATNLYLPHRRVGQLSR